MSILDQHWFSNITRPSRYLGNEINSIKKTSALTEVSVALVFPDIYEVGMSHLGLKILYHILNSQNWLAAERAFSPWPDLEQELRQQNLPPTTLETNQPLSSFDIIGFSLQHELSYTNVLNMLDLSHIPFLTNQRTDESPFIIAGGPACFNPEPVADIFDLMVIGDGEEVTLKICEAIREAKKKKRHDKKDLLSHLHHIKGVYIPSYFSIRHSPEGPVETIEPVIPSYPIVEKAILPNIDKFPYPERQIVPFTELVHDRVAIEICRGCTRGCRFCQAGMIYRPVRERSPESVLDKADKVLGLTGYDELSLLSLSSGDYCSILPLLKALMDRQARKKIAISLPSLRMDSLDPSVIEQIKRVRKTGFTLAPEAGNDRLRRIINKRLTQKDILETARAVYEAGWKLMKLYFMIGLPFETDRDIHDIIALAKEVAKLAGKKGKRAKLNVSVSTFVPKSHTPFMWLHQISLEESKSKIQLIQEGLAGTRVRVKWNQPELSWLEGIFSRGDRRLTKVLIEAWKLGAKFDAWGEHFQMEIWNEAFSRAEINPYFYLNREKSLDEILPWDHIRSGVTKTYLKREWKKAQRGELTPDCREKCLECGVCDHETVDPLLFRDWNAQNNLEKPPDETIPLRTKKYRLTFTKLDHARYLGHLELVRVFIRAFKRAGLNLIYSKGFHPMPKVVFGCALPVGTESMQETVDVEDTAFADTSFLKKRINRQLPSGIAVTSVKVMSHRKQKMRLKESHFIVTLNGAELKEAALEGFLKSDYFPVVKAGKKGEHKINVRPLVKFMDRFSPNGIKLVMRHASGPEAKPAEIIKSVFSLNDSQINCMRILKTKQVLE
ncbi:MAG: TIGR03960 family B12-binding radical SAM protein [Desulfobacteraceae bacterium]|nr:MAG: TIGR03960 family B12-binding radical SAM protein [Desulfobacteraceae bacterium]